MVALDQGKKTSLTQQNALLNMLVGIWQFGGSGLRRGQELLAC